MFEINEFDENKKRRKIGCGKKPLLEEIDKELFEFLEKERDVGWTVSNKLLGIRAKKIGVKYRINGFKALAQYIANFKKQFNISMRIGTTDWKKSPEELRVEIKCFLNCMKELHKMNSDKLQNREHGSNYMSFQCTTKWGK